MQAARSLGRICAPLLLKGSLSKLISRVSSDLQCVNEVMEVISGEELCSPAESPRVNFNLRLSVVNARATMLEGFARQRPERLRKFAAAILKETAALDSMIKDIMEESDEDYTATLGKINSAREQATLYYEAADDFDPVSNVAPAPLVANDAVNSSNPDLFRFRKVEAPVLTDACSYRVWWEYFFNTIHNNKSLDNRHRVIHLFTSSSGDARAFLKGFSQTGDEYERILEAVKARYGDPAKLIQFYLADLAAFPNLFDDHDVTLEQTRANLDKIKSLLLGLTTAGHSDNAIMQGWIFEKMPKFRVHEAVKELDAKYPKRDFLIEELIIRLEAGVAADEFIELRRVNKTTPADDVVPAMTLAQGSKYAKHFLICCNLLALAVGVEVRIPCSIDKQTGYVDCRNRNLPSVPKDLPPETRILDLSGNKIRQLDATSFKNCPFVTEIYLAKNELSTVHYATFTNLDTLKVLDLGHNLLSHFNVDIPVFVEVLYLNNNPLSSGHIFQQRLIYIRYLSLAGTNMTQPSIFSSFLPTLQYLDLRDIPNLTLSVSDLKKLRHLRTLYISPRMFSGRNRSQKCREFIKAAREFKTEVKAFSCFPEENFAIKARTFERVYQVDEAMYDYPDNVLNVETENATGLNELQMLVSDGVTNFIKSILVEKEQTPSTPYKIKEPMTLEDYSSSSGQISLVGVQMKGFPALKPLNRVVLEVASADAEELKRYRLLYRTAENKREIIIIGNYRMYADTGNFTCKFANTNYESARQMLRRYDFLTWPTNIKEVLEFEKMDCQIKRISGNADVVAQVIDAVLTALSKSWLDSVINIANTVSLEPTIRNMSSSFTRMYRERVLSKVIGASLDYLKNINVDSFDVTPSLSAVSNDTGAVELVMQNQYNVKIVNLFNYTDFKIEYSVDETTFADTMKILGKYVVFYNHVTPAVFTISARENPSDVMKVIISSIEFDVHFNVKTVNKVHRFAIGHVNARVMETESERTNILYLMFKKYLGIELSKELRRSLTYLTSKVDFYSLNVL